MKKQNIGALALLMGVMCFFTAGVAQSQMITIPSQLIELDPNWSATYSVTKGKFALTVQTQCNVFQRTPDLSITTFHVNECFLHPFPFYDFEGESDDFMFSMDKSSCSAEIDCCKPTCLRKIQRAMADVPFTKIIGCANGKMEIGFEALLDDIYARCGSPPSDGIAQIGLVKFSPSQMAHIPVHGRWFYSNSPAATNLRIGIDRLVISSSEDGKQPLMIDRSDVFASDDTRIKVLQNKNSKFAIHLSATLTSMDDDNRMYQGLCRFYAGSSSIEFNAILMVNLFTNSRNEKRWEVRHIEIANNDVMLYANQNDKYAPGVNGFSATPRIFNSELIGGDEFYTVLKRSTGVQLVQEILTQQTLSINIPMNPMIAQRRDTTAITVPEVRVVQEDRVVILTDPSAPALRRAMVTLMTKIKNTQAMKVQLIPVEETPSFVWYEEIDAECTETECNQFWRAVTGFVTEDKIDSLTGMYVVGFDILECSPTDETAVEEGRCHRSMYTNLRTNVKTMTAFEEVRKSLIFKSQLALETAALTNLQPVKIGDRLRGKACLYDDLTGELDTSVDVQVPRIALVMMCKDDDTMAYDMLIDGKPYEGDDEVTRDLNAKMLMEPAPNGCVQYEFNVIAVKECPYMTLGFDYEVRPHIHGDHDKRDVVVSIQQTNGTQAVLVVTDGSNTGTVNLTLNSTNNYQAVAQFLWDDDDTAASSTTVAATTGIAAILWSSGHSSSSESKHTSKAVLVHFDSHGHVKSRHTVESSSEGGWGIWVALIVLVVIILAVILFCFIYPGVGYFGSSFPRSDEDVEVFLGTAENYRNKSVVKGDNNVVEQHTHVYPQQESQVKRRNVGNKPTEDEFPTWEPPATQVESKIVSTPPGFNVAQAQRDGLFGKTNYY